MELKQLRYFDAVAETCHFGRAAEVLHLAQPALSHSIRRLEDELGVVLLARTTRQVRLTGAGEFFHREVRRILGDLDASVSGARSIAEGRTGLLRLGFTGTSAFTQLTRLTRLLKAAVPGIVLDVQADLLTPAQVERLLDARLDLGVLRGPVADPTIRTRTVLHEPLVLALPSDHPLAPEAHVGLADVSGEPFIAYADSRSAVNGAFLSACRQVGFSPQVRHRAPGTAALLAMVAADLGVAVVPQSVRTMQLQGVVFRDLREPTTIDLSLAWRAEDGSPLVGAVLAALEAGDFFATAADALSAPLPEDAP